MLHLLLLQKSAKHPNFADCVSRSSLDRVSISLKNMVYVGTVTCDENPKLCDKLPAETSVLLLVQGATPSKSVATILKEAVVRLV